MAHSKSDVEAFLKRDARSVLVRVAETKGSTPRGCDAWMIVQSVDQIGTIGGGELEWSALATARKTLSGHIVSEASIKLGPESSQCCGGVANLTFHLITSELQQEFLHELDYQEQARPRVYLFGAGHVGAALARALNLLPVDCHIVDTRKSMLDALEKEELGNVTLHLSAMPEALIEGAPSGSSYVVLTHDHALDFLITSTALERSDAPYVGLIGSKTKRAKFKNWLEDHGGELIDFTRLTSPIGGGSATSKKPEIIAALAAAEIISILQVQ